MPKSQPIPYASVVVLSYNGLEEATRPCLESVLKNTPEDSYELVVVDNASSDETPNYLKALAEEHSHIRLCLNDTNRGYAGGNNDGMRLASGEYLVLLNNDTLVSPGWLNRLITLLNEQQDVGLVGPVTNTAGNEQRIVLQDLNERNFEQITEKYTQNQKGIWFFTQKLGFFCVAMRKAVVDRVGYLDECFGIGMFEDDDYCIRAQSAGFKLAILEDCFIFHKGSLSFKKLTSDAYAELFSRNREYFFQKHKLPWVYSDTLKAVWEKLRCDIVQLANIKSQSLERLSVRLGLMDDVLSQVHQVEKQNAKIGGQGMADEIVDKKHRELMEISDWASDLKQQNSELAVMVDEKHRELMEISDWASNLKKQNDALEKYFQSWWFRLFSIMRKYGLA